MKNLVICGDSFNAGIGCRDLEKSPYFALLGDKLGLKPIVLARGSASNYTIFLQAQHILEDKNIHPELVIIGLTSYDRIEWVAENARIDDPNAEFKASNVNYHQYGPAHGYFDQKQHPYYFKDKPEYNPQILSEQICAFEDYFTHVKNKSHGGKEYYKRLHSEPLDKLEIIQRYSIEIMEYKIKRHYDMGLIFMAYSMLKNNGIRCLVLADDVELRQLIGDDAVDISWGSLSDKYPDTIGSLHTSEEGHRIVADALYAKIQNDLR